MKLRSYRITILITTILLTAGTLIAQSNEQTAGGNAKTGVFWSQGNDITGGTANGTSSATFSAKDALAASGGATANGMATSSQSGSPNSLTNVANVTVDSGAEANGRLATTFKVTGSAEQTNWAEIGNSQNFAFGGTGSKASYASGEIADTSPMSGWGTASANGMTKLTTEFTENSAKSTINSTGASLSEMGGTAINGISPNDPPFAKVSGTGTAGAQSMLGGGANDNFFAAAGINGTAAYNAADLIKASGSLTIKGETKTAVTSGGVSASASMSSAANAAGACSCH